ncbi:MAG: cobalamin B12-binding domain-containing protein [Planctomycetota bacterium]|nr:cobalamin B12-binding domain-containing protein [Planctomycetota bacterium]
MNHEHLMERLFEILINGDRPASRALIKEMQDGGMTGNDMLTDIYWPSYEAIERLNRNDQLTILSYRLATRLLRVMIDQTSTLLEHAPRNGRSIFASCGPSEGEELGGQIAIDLLEAEGYNVTFSGGGVAADEILAMVQESKPQILLMFCSAPGDLPQIRHLIDSIREIGACPNMQIAVGGGVFTRADGLAEEIGADISASSPRALYEELSQKPNHRSEANREGTARTRRPRRKAA